MATKKQVGDQIRADFQKRDLQKVRQRYKKDFNLSFKISREHKEILEQYFVENGNTLSAGIRQLIYDFMRTKNLI